MNGKVFLWLCFVLFVVSCTPQVEPGAGGAPRVGKIVPEGEPVRIELSPTTEKIPNCSGSISTISKNPAMTIVTNHSMEWEVGGQTGAGMTIGEGVIPFGVDLSSALTGSTAEGIDQGFTQSSSWNLSAAPGEIVEYTLAWWELWQPGYIDITMADQTVTRVNVRYRSGIRSDITAQIAYDCNGQIISVITGNNSGSSSALPDPSSPESITVTPISTASSLTNLSSGQVPIRVHTPFSAGDGVFANVTVSDGQAEFSRSELDTNHQHIQRIRREEQPSGCDEANYASGYVWVTGTPGMKLTVNGQEVGTYSIAPDFHGYMLDLSLSVGDQVCAVDFGSEGFSIIFGPDVFYHYDSYCYRFSCP